MKKNSILTCSSLSLLIVVLAFLIITPFVSAADYPTRAIAIVVGSSPGGGFDLQGRLFCKYWPRYLPRQVPMIIRNITGGGGVRSANQVWKAKPDGYTIVQLKTGPYILNEILYPDQIKFRMNRWQYIGRYTYDVSVLLARAELVKKLKNYQDLIKFGKKKPLKGVTGGVSSSMHNKQLIFSEASGIPMNFVHFPGAMQALASIMRDEADFAIMSVSTAMKQDPKEMGILFIFNDDKGRFASVAPTALEYGVPENVLQKITSNPVFVAPRTLAVPPQTPPKVVKILRDSFWKVVTSKDFNRAVERVGHFMEPLSAQDFLKHLPKMIADVEKFAPTLKKHIK